MNTANQPQRAELQPPVLEVAAQPTKWWLHSKTMLLNSVVLALSGIAALVDFIQPNLPVLQALLPPAQYSALLGCLALSNAALRMSTTAGISIKREPPTTSLGAPVPPGPDTPPRATPPQG